MASFPGRRAFGSALLVGPFWIPFLCGGLEFWHLLEPAFWPFLPLFWPLALGSRVFPFSRAPAIPFLSGLVPWPSMCWDPGSLVRSTRTHVSRFLLWEPGPCFALACMYCPSLFGSFAFPCLFKLKFVCLSCLPRSVCLPCLVRLLALPACLSLLAWLACVNRGPSFPGSRVFARQGSQAAAFKQSLDLDGSRPLG